MHAAGVDTFLELGPGKTVSGFVKKTLEGVTILNIEDLDGMCAVLQKLEVAL
jgi:[acyl-carrier-protein] S-malonyltransferase